MRRELRCVPLLCALSLIALSCGGEPPRLKLDTGVLRVGGREIRVEIARTPPEMSRGLMYRRSLGKECGMLFPYETPRILSFWMKNTRIPLDIAFLDDGGRILQIEEMRPYDELGRTVSREPVRYALEMNRGWFAENGVGVGDVVEIPNPKSQNRGMRRGDRYVFFGFFSSSVGIWDLGFGISHGGPPVRILFMGTPEFAVPSLDALAGGGQEVCAVATRPDRPRGRNLAVAAPPVKRRAGELGLRLLQPADPGDAAFIGEVREMNPDLIAVVAYGNFLPPALWGLPPRGTINLHPSLLPKYRGAAPIPRAIMNGDRETGVTVLYLGAGMDAGDIVAQERVPISADDTGGTLAAALAKRGGGLLLAAVRSIEEGTAARVPQDESAATFAPKLEKSDGLIDWRLSAEDLARRVRALRPWPGTFTFAPLRGGTRLLKILEASASAGDAGETGKVLRCDSAGIHVGTGSGSLVIRAVQPEGGRAMTALEFVRGTRDLAGTMLGR